MNPEWSPTGKTVAVTGPNYTGIYLLSFPGGDVTQISDDPGAGLGMQWSPDGARILTTLSRYEERQMVRAVAVFDVLSGQKKVLTGFQTAPTGAPRWSKDGKEIFLVGEKKVVILDSNRGGTVREPPAGTGEKILLSHRGDIVVHDLAEGRRDVLAIVEGEKLNLTVSPDREKVAFEIMGGHLWVATIDGKKAVDLGVGYRPSWAPTSDKIAYMVTTDDGHQYLTSDIYAINADGSGRIRITATADRLEMSPSWSPDGKWIAYHTLKQGKILVQEVR